MALRRRATRTWRCEEGERESFALGPLRRPVDRPPCSLDGRCPGAPPRSPAAGTPRRGRAGCRGAAAQRGVVRAALNAFERGFDHPWVRPCSLPYGTSGSSPWMAQPRRYPAGPAAENARNAEPGIMQNMHSVHPALEAAPLMSARSRRSGRATIACCVTEVVRPAHTRTSARDAWSVIARPPANWPMRQASGCSSDACAHRLAVGLGILEPVDEFGREPGRILLVGEVPQTVEKSPPVRCLDVFAGTRRTPGADRRIE